MSIEARRHSPRISLNETAYVNFAPGIRGLILDISEGGLRFKTSSPISTSDSVRFWLPLSQRTEGTAQLAWTDSSRTTGGLRFTTVPLAIRTQIRDWIEGGGTSDPTTRATVAALLAEEEAAQAWVNEPGSRAEARAKHLAGFDVAGASEAADEDIESAVSYPAQFSPPSREKIRAGDLFHKPRPSLIAEDKSMSMFPFESTATGGYTLTSPPKSSRFAVGVLVLLILLGAAAVAGEYYYPSETRTLMSRAQAKAEKFINPEHKQAISDVEPASMAGASRFEGSFEPGKPAENATVVPENPPVVPVPPPASNAAAADHQSDESASIAADAEVPTPKTNAETELELAQTYLAKGTSPDQKAKAVELLWLATEKGNVDAEIQLADLYASGEAVQKSCVQARILLKAAAAANPSAAKPKLDALDQSGCN
jgi:hypothetical protein